MFDLDKLSYQAYGILVIVVLTIIAVLLNLFPFSLVGLIICLIQVPVYLFARSRFSDPIHANGLNICFVLTTLFYILLFVCVKCLLALTNLPIAIIFSVILSILSCYTTSTLPNKMEKLGKLFFGYKKHDESKYEKLIEYIKYNGISKEILEAEERLKILDSQMYLIYKRKFRENKTFKEISEEFDIENPRIVEILDKVYFYMIGTLNI